MNIFHVRQGQMEASLCYFYTDTIHDFKHLLANDELKMICIDSWKYLKQKDLIEIYGYVIMPNHIHLLWMMKGLNGKESPAGSFAKFTAHQFQKVLRQKDNKALLLYESMKADRTYQFWKRDPLAVSITSKKALLQKLDYIHNNPVQEKWNLAALPEEYRWSSASFYLTGKDEFGILTHYDDQLFRLVKTPTDKKKHPSIVANAMEAYQRCGLTVVKEPIRGGTDGSRFSYMGLPCPNLFTGMQAIHSKHEWVGVDDMEQSANMLVQLVQVWEEKSN